MNTLSSSTRPVAIAAAFLAGGCLLIPADAQNTPPTPVPAASPPAAGLDSDDFLPEAFTPQEHATTWANPPFSRKVLPDAAPDQAPPGPTPWDGWQIAAVDQFGGSFTVGLVTKKNEFRLIKEGEMNEEEGVRVTKVESNGIITDTIVHVSDGTRSGTITFESKRLTVAAKPPAGAKPPARGVAAPRRNTATQLTPQQKAAQAAQQRKAQAEITNHLNSAAKTNPAATTGGGAAPAPQPTTRTRRRSVVLPPSTRN